MPVTTSSRAKRSAISCGNVLKILNVEILMVRRYLCDEKNENTNPSLNIVTTIQDAVHVANRQQQGFSNWHSTATRAQKIS